MVNCGILTEGVDIPQIDAIFLARPTQSLGLLQQMLGRGLRRHDSKECCAVVDFVDVVSANKTYVLASPATLLGLPEEFHAINTVKGIYTMRREEVKDISPATIMKESHITFKAFKAEYLNELEKDNEVLSAFSSFSWVRIGPRDFCLILPDHSTILLIKEGEVWKSYIHTRRRVKEKYFQQKKWVADHGLLDSAIRGWFIFH